MKYLLVLLSGCMFCCNPEPEPSEPNCQVFLGPYFSFQDSVGNYIKNDMDIDSLFILTYANDTLFVGNSVSCCLSFGHIDRYLFPPNSVNQGVDSFVMVYKADTILHKCIFEYTYERRDNPCIEGFRSINYLLVDDTTVFEQIEVPSLNDPIIVRL